MTSLNQNRLHQLCAYGVSPDRSESLMQQYKDEDDVPLFELDSTRTNLDD